MDPLPQGVRHDFYVEGVATPGVDPEYRTLFRIDRILVIANVGDFEILARKEFELQSLLDEEVFSYLRQRGAPPSLCFSIDEILFLMRIACGEG